MNTKASNMAIAILGVVSLGFAFLSGAAMLVIADMQQTIMSLEKDLYEKQQELDEEKFPQQKTIAENRIAKWL